MHIQAYLKMNSLHLLSRKSCICSHTYKHTILHELCDDVDGLFLGNYSIEADQLVMLEALHKVCFHQECLHRHTARLHGLHSHLGVLVVCG